MNILEKLKNAWQKSEKEEEKELRKAYNCKDLVKERKNKAIKKKIRKKSIGVAEEFGSTVENLNTDKFDYKHTYSDKNLTIEYFIEKFGRKKAIIKHGEDIVFEHKKYGEITSRTPMYNRRHQIKKYKPGIWEDKLETRYNHHKSLEAKRMKEKKKKQRQERKKELKENFDIDAGEDCYLCSSYYYDDKELLK